MLFGLRVYAAYSRMQVSEQPYGTTGFLLSQGQNKKSLPVQSVWGPGRPPRRCQTVNRSSFEDHPPPGRAGDNDSSTPAQKCVILLKDHGAKFPGIPMSLIFLKFCMLQNSFSIWYLSHTPPEIPLEKNLEPRRGQFATQPGAPPRIQPFLKFLDRSSCNYNHTHSYIRFQDDNIISAESV